MSAELWDKINDLYREGHLDEVALIELSKALSVVEEIEDVVVALETLKERGLGFVVGSRA